VPPVKQPRAPRTSPEVRRAQMVRVAVAAFARDGYAGVQVQAIADEVGVTRNLINHYFPGGKRELYLDAVDSACEELGGLLDVDPDVPLASKMPANISTYLDHVLEPSPIYMLYARAGRSADEDVRQTALAMRERIALRIARNHLGTGRPGRRLHAALIGYIAFTETTCEQWSALGLRDRAALERLLRDVLVATVAAGRPG
jgi:AcrR family transcriptional regulator